MKRQHIAESLCSYGKNCFLVIFCGFLQADGSLEVFPQSFHSHFVVFEIGSLLVFSWFTKNIFRKPRKGYDKTMKGLPKSTQEYKLSASSNGSDKYLISSNDNDNDKYQNRKRKKALPKRIWSWHIQLFTCLNWHERGWKRLEVVSVAEINLFPFQLLLCSSLFGHSYILRKWYFTSYSFLCGYINLQLMASLDRFGLPSVKLNTALYYTMLTIKVHLSQFDRTNVTYIIYIYDKEWLV